MRSLLAIFAVFALTISCCDDEEAPLVCGVENPVNDLPWLKAEAEKIQESEFSRQYFYIMQADYNGSVVFFINNCCPTCDTFLFYYNCEGERLEDLDHSQVKNPKRIWAPAELECVFTN